MRATGVFLAALVVLAAVGCAQRVDMEAERAAMLEAFVAGQQALIAKDTESFVSLWVDEPLRFPPNAPKVTGTEALREFTSQFLATPGLALSFGEQNEGEVSRAGDLGYTIASYEVTMDDAEGNSVTAPGKVVVIWKKQPDGSWKAVLDIWNSDQAAPTAATE